MKMEWIQNLAILFFLMRNSLSRNMTDYELDDSEKGENGEKRN